MIQEDLLTVLLANSYVTDIVGSRIYPLRVPQKAQLPAVVYQRVSVEAVNSLSGDSYLDRARIQVTCWAASYSAAVNLADRVRQAINRSDLKSITEMEMDTEDPDTKAYGVITDYSIWHTVEELPRLDLEFLLLESGNYLLLETGLNFSMEDEYELDVPDEGDEFFLLESGDELLLSSGEKIVLEEEEEEALNYLLLSSADFLLLESNDQFATEA